MIVVFDSDVLIPMVLEASRSARLFERLRTAGHDVAISPQILDEVREKMLTKARLRAWLNLPDERITAFLDDLATICLVVPGHVSAYGSVPADPKDEKIVAAAIESNADYIVSEDRHLRDLKDYQRVPIMSRDEFAVELDRLGVP